MPLFRHSPTSRLIHATGARAARYRRSSRFTELTTPDSPESHRIASDGPEPSSLHHDTTTTPPEGTVAEILEGVAGDEDRRQAALEAELAGRNRVTLLRKLQG